MSNLPRIPVSFGWYSLPPPWSSKKVASLASATLNCTIVPLADDVLQHVVVWSGVTNLHNRSQYGKRLHTSKSENQYKKVPASASYHQQFCILASSYNKFCKLTRTVADLVKGSGSYEEEKKHKDHLITWNVVFGIT